MTSPLKTELKNINIDTVENCNLLCKLVMDYMTTNTCVIEPVDSEGKSATSASNSNSFRIIYPEGSFINYRDTNYELTYAYFFYPSRHSIDGERYDLEVNLYHGNFKDGTKGKGLVAHTHYHNDTEKSNLHKHFHYHLNDDGTSGNSSAHNETDDQHTEKNIVTCLLYNMGKHTGSDVNIFFNQFIHHPEFKKLKSQTNVTEINITVHDNWAIEQIYPKKRSYFMYDEESDKNTYVIFDTIQTISKEIIDRLYERGIKGATGIKGDTGFDINNLTNYTPTNATSVLYRKNIEVITDEQYKKSTRAQIKDLLSLTRMSTYKPSKRTTKEYNYISENITKSISGGRDTGYQTNEAKAKRVADMWKIYGRDLPIEMKADSIVSDYNLIYFSSDITKKYKYLEKIYKTFEVEDNSFDMDSDNDNESSFIQYIKSKRAFLKLAKFYYNYISPSADDYDGGKGDQRSPKKDKSLFTMMSGNVFAIKKDLKTLFKIIKEEDEDMNPFAAAAGVLGAQFTMGASLGLLAIQTTSKYNIFVGEDAFIKKNNISNKPNWTEFIDDELRDDWVARHLEKNGLKNAAKLKELVDDIIESLEFQEDGKDIFELYATDHKFILRFFFEELDLQWQKEHDANSNLYGYISDTGRNATLTELFDVLKGVTKTETETAEIVNKIITLKEDFIFVKRGEVMTRTLSNEECQPWLSSEVHMEGDLWKFWEKAPEMKKTAKLLFNDLGYLKEKIGDGMLEYEGETDSKWKTHNECRNPGNTGSAPWCYTKNPNKRWEYCSKPVYSDKWGKFVLFLIFIFLGVIAYLTIKTFYLHEYPMKWVASLTGGTFASKETFAGQAGTGASTGTGKGGVAPKTT